jgi:predicted nucleic acid-binding Zn finger protein
MGEVKLVLNKKQDAYYTVKGEACSCPDYLYRQSAKGERCKHMALFDMPKPHEDVKPMSLRENIWNAEQQERNRSCAKIKMEAI